MSEPTGTGPAPALELGGLWTPRGCKDDRPHGLDLIHALAGTGNWGIHGDAEHGRIAWARLDWP